jgi:16S rRNA (guanine966-N2)-methyltransferase
MGARTNQVRIIAGQWRGRKLDFPDVEGLRPTADRVRETLFNWLAPTVEGSVCLDLFAGSGALGFEAASRGAARVVMVDSDRKVVAGLERMQQKLSAGTLQIICDDASHYLAKADQKFDIVFLDPPFSDPRCLEAALAAIVAGRFLKPGGFLYLETPGSPPALPETFALYRDKRAGQVNYRLLSYHPE